jgi:hypothetical protein
VSKPTPEKLLKRYRMRIEAAQGFRRDENLDDLWRRLNDLYKGKHFPEGLSSADQIAVNVCFATINVMGPSVAVNHPKITVTPTVPDDADKALILEGVVNYWWRKYEVLPEFQRAVKDFLIYGHGWLKTGYRYVEKDVDDPEGFDKAFKQQVAEADAAAMENPELAGELPTDDEIAAGIPSTRKVVEHDAPFVERCSPHDIFVDPEATSMQDLRWIAQKVIKTLEEVKASDSYKPSAIDACKSDSHMSQDWFTADPFRKKDSDDIKRVTVWEFYDLVAGTMCVFPEAGGDEFFVDPVDQPYSFGHPFVMLRNYDVPEQFYPMGELESLEPLQHELNGTRTAMFNDRKSFRRAWLVRMEHLGKAGRAALVSDEDNRAIPVEGNQPFSEIIAPLPGQQINPQLYQDSSLIEQDITNISGVSEYMRGSLPEIRRTATEAAILQDTANARAADKLARVEWAIGAVGSRMVKLAQQYMSEGQVARVTGKNGQPFHFYFEREDIEGDFDFEVQGGSTQPKNDMMRRQQAAELLQALSPYGDPQLGLVNMRAVIEHALRDGFGITNPEKFLAEPADGGGLAGMGMSPEEMAAMEQEAIPMEDAGSMPAPPNSPGGPQEEYIEDAVAGIPPELAQQLIGQVGAPL